MKIALIIFLLIIPNAYAFGETYKWEDADAIYFSDNPESIPEKYREKVLEEARGEIQTQKTQEIESLPPNTNKVNNENKYETSNVTKPLPPPINFVKNTYVPINIKEDYEPISMFIVAVILISTSLFIIWIIILADVVRSKFRITSNKVLWLLLVTFMAPLGMLLYLLLGFGQKERRFCARDAVTLPAG